MSRQTIIGTMAGALFALIAWWPIEGAVTAVFWPKVFDAKGPDDVAIDTLLAAHEETIDRVTRRETYIGPLGDQNCIYRFDREAARRQNSRSGATLLNAAIHHERNKLNDDDTFGVAKASLRALPDVALGALQGCVGGSLLADSCRRYVGQRIADAIAAHQRDLTLSADANDAYAIKMACAALVGALGATP